MGGGRRGDGCDVEGGGPGGGWGRRTLGEGTGPTGWASVGAGAHRDPCKVLLGSEGEGANGGLPGPRTECSRCKPRALEGVIWSWLGATCAVIHKA